MNTPIQANVSRSPESGTRLISNQITAPKPQRNLQLLQGGKLPENHYRVSLKYAGMPNMACLYREFGKKYVSKIYDGRDWALTPACESMDRTPGQKVLHVLNFEDRWTASEAISLAAKLRTTVAVNGFRPATSDEMYDFQVENPGILNIVALGSTAPFDGTPSVAMLWNCRGQQILGEIRYFAEFGASLRALLVAR